MQTGFSLYGREHLAALALILAWTAGMLVFLHPRRAYVKRAAKGYGIIMVLMEILRDARLLYLGEFSVGYLPLHLCSLGMLLCLWYGFRRGDRGGSLYLLCLPGALCALLFPNWTHLPVGHFVSIHSFVYHGLLLQSSLLPLLGGKLRFRDAAAAFGVLCMAAAVVGGLNLWLGTNYMFLQRPSPGSPLVYLAELPGRYGYQIGLAALSAGVILSISGITTAIQRCGKSNKDLL